MNIEIEIKDIVKNPVFMSVYCKLHSCVHNSLDHNKQALKDTHIMGQRVWESTRIIAIKTEEHTKKQNK
jgi:hypothetical protein